MQGKNGLTGGSRYSAQFSVFSPAMASSWYQHLLEWAGRFSPACGVFKTLLFLRVYLWPAVTGFMLASVSCMVIPGKGGGKLIYSKKSYRRNKLFFLLKRFQGIQSGVWKAIPFPQRCIPYPRLHPWTGLMSSNSCFSLNFQTSGSPFLSMWKMVLGVLCLQSNDHSSPSPFHWGYVADF